MALARSRRLMLGAQHVGSSVNLSFENTLFSQVIAFVWSVCKCVVSVCVYVYVHVCARVCVC